ncbi:TcfC E-set like domain-containing protein [Salmonella enterica]|nr:hypothetical protein [Salmonella enterica]ELI0025978.1 TcfC E-set like domain-containing protein [Salmonella enterica]ELI0151775.1 TcfC E-set like domain-containing protein [Salmonella enterica]
MFRHSFIAIAVSVTCYSVASATGRPVASVSPVSLTLASGQSLAMSRYARILTPEKQKIQLIFDGVTEATLSADISLDTVKFTDETELARFFRVMGLEESEIKTLLAQNRQEGFPHSALCKGPRSECVISSDSVDFSIDYYNDTVRVFVNPKVLRHSDSEKTYLELNGGPGLMNNLSAYYDNTFHSDSANYFLRNEGVSGFRQGYLTYNMYKSDSLSRVDELAYTHALFADNKVSLGRMMSAANFNASSSLSLLSGNQLTGLRVGNASELIDRSYGKKTFRYYSPANGTLEVSKNGELVYAEPARAGYSDLNLASLPAGQYNALLRIKSPAGDVISTQTVLVNNTGSFDNSFSYHIFAGKNTYSQNYLFDSDKSIFDGGFQIPVTGYAGVFLGGTLVDNKKILGSGMNFKNESLSASMKYGIGEHDFRYAEFSVYVDSFSAYYRKNRFGEGWSKKRKEANDSSYTINYGNSLTQNISMNIGYTYSSTLIPYYYNDDDDFFSNEQRTTFRNRGVFSNIFYNFENGGSVFLGANKDLTTNRYDISLGISLPLGRNITLSSTAYYNSDQKLTDSSTVNYSQQLPGNWSHSLSASSYLGGEQYNSLGYSLSHSSNLLRGTGYYYKTDNGQSRVSLSGSSSQIISGNGINFISNSYSSRDSGFIVRSRDAGYDVAVRDTSDNTTRYLDDKDSIVTIPAWHKLVISGNTEDSDYIFTDGSSRYTKTLALTPGASVNIDEKIVKISNIIATIKSKRNGYAERMSCADDACVSVTRLNKGVFRVKFTGEITTLKSDNDSCVVRIRSGSKFANITCD